MKGLLSAAHRGVQDIVTRIIPSRTPSPEDRAIYKAGWRAVKLPDGAAIENREKHAAFIEDGVRASNVKIGAAMISALAAWTQRKGIASGADSIKIAWAIAKKMQKRGIFGQRGMGILRELVEQRLDKIVQDEVTKEILIAVAKAAVK